MTSDADDLLRDDTEQVKSLKQKVKHLQEQKDKLEESLEKARKSRHRIPTQRARASGRGAFIRVFLPDTHGNLVDPEALKAFLGDLKYLQPREIYMMGDHLDCGGWLAAHHTLGFIPETENSFEQDVCAANALLDRVQEICPKAKIWYLEGNHEERIEKWIISSVMRHGKDAGFLRNLCGPEAVLSLEKRNIPYITKGKFYNGCRVQGTIKAGRCYVTHGTRHGKNAAQQMLNRFGASVVFGHVHKLMSCMDRNVKDGEIGAWSVGHLSRQQPYWRHGDPTDWSQGYGFAIVQKDEDFLHVNIPIIEGKSFLGSLGKLLT